jgi:PAS domain-containing protein
MSKIKQRSMGKEVFIVLGALCLIFVLLGTLFFFSLRAIEHQRQTEQARAHQKLDVINKLPRTEGLRQAEVFHHVLETNVEEMARHDQIIRELGEASARILSDFEVLLENGKERHLFTRLLEARKVSMERTEELLVLSRSNMAAEKTRVALTKQSPAYLHYHRVGTELVEEAEENARHSRANTSRLIWKLRQGTGVIVGLAVLFTLGAGFIFASRITRRLRADNASLQAEVTERKLTEDSLRESEEKFRQLAGTITDVFYVTSPNLQQMHYVSPAYEGIWGRSTESL